MNLKEIKDILKNHKQRLIDKYAIKSLGIFGSYARQEYTEKSDIDILVEFDKPTWNGFIDLSIELEKILQKKVDLVSKKGVKPKYLYFVEKDLIYV